MESLNISIDHERDLIRVTAVGELIKSDGEKIITLARTVAAEHGFDVLYDVRQTRTKIPVVEWFQLPRNLEVFKDEKKFRVKAAVLISPEDDVEKYRFYETVTTNLGINLKIFFEEEEAIEWLCKKPSTSWLE